MPCSSPTRGTAMDSCHPEAGLLSSTRSHPLILPQRPRSARLLHAVLSSNSGDSGEALQMTSSSHPDALRRQIERQQREGERREELVFASEQWWKTPMPDNMLAISSPDQYLRVVDESPLMVSSFFVPWCMGCRRMSPKWRKIAQNNPRVTFASVNCTEADLQALAESLGISILPFFRFYAGGVLRTQLAANLTRIDRLRAEIAFLLSSSEEGLQQEGTPLLEET